jgi:hypothetical protein
VSRYINITFISIGYISITIVSPKITFKVEGYECSRCGHRWIPRTKTDTEPTICPKCKSPYWDKPRRSDTATQLEQARQSMKIKRKRIKEDEF